MRVAFNFHNTWRLINTISLLQKTTDIWVQLTTWVHIVLGKWLLYRECDKYYYQSFPRWSCIIFCYSGDKKPAGRTTLNSCRPPGTAVHPWAAQSLMLDSMKSRDYEGHSTAPLTSGQRWFNAAPTSQTLTHHWTSVDECLTWLQCRLKVVFCFALRH